MLKEKIKIRVAGFLFINKKLLLVEHHKEKSLHWVLPGGGVEFHETAKTALKRELKEELNLEVRVDDFLFVDEVIWENRHNIDLYFSMSLTGPLKIKLEEGSALNGYKFFSQNDIPAIILKPDLKDIIMQTFENNFYKGFKTYEN